MTGVTITAHDPRVDSDEQITELVEFDNVRLAELLPDDPPRDPAVVIAAHRALPDRIRRWSFRARDADGALVGVGSCRIDPEHDDDPDVLFLELRVHPRRRREGIGTRLLAELIGVAVAESRTRVFANVTTRDAGGQAFATGTGAEQRYVERVNHLPVSAVDRPMLERWVAEGPVRAPGYELLAFDGACPDEHADGFVHLVTVLNDAPRGDLELNDMTFTREQMRERDAVLDAAGHQRWTLMARHASGAYAGMHDVRWHPAEPAVVWVGLTTVDPAHRGHALGKWLKAAMTLRILDERPAVRDIRTGNADTNEAMLGINHAMGYRMLLGFEAWMAPTERVAAWLDAKGVAQGAGSPV